jgi:hypothetical protein
MARLSEIRSEALRRAFLRDEIPEVMVWLRNDGIEQVDPETLDRYLSGDGEVGPERLDPLVELGLLRRTAGGRYELTEAGIQHGSQVLDHHFADLDKIPSVPVLCACGCCGELPEPGGVEGATGAAAGAGA